MSSETKDYHFKAIGKRRVKNGRYRKVIRRHGNLSGAAARTGKKR